ncbi:MAG: DUF418 domain-containing protein [Pseudomonadota bacterium]
MGDAIQPHQRIHELDILRGFALLGVFLVHFVGAAFYALPIDDIAEQAFLESFSDRAALFVSDWLFESKANTLFGVLFGMGFWIMMQRLSESGRDFRGIYARRLGALLFIGLVNVFLIFPGDVLHEYALIGFVLMALRALPTKWLLWLGITLAVLGSPAMDHVMWANDLWNDDYDIAQEAAFADGRYWNWVMSMTFAHIDRNFLHFGVAGWALYVLGRFLLGAWVMKTDLIGWVTTHHKTHRNWAIGLLVFGLVIELVSLLIYDGVIPGNRMVESMMHAVGAPIVAMSYAFFLIVLYHSRQGRRAVLWFAPVGRIALTAYVVHGAVYTLLYMPFGLDLLGTLGPLRSFVVALMLYAALTAFAHAWLQHYRYGPLEYLWRWATYGKRPVNRLATA